jgi:L-alanine-DL-glutamate epimerase-like enolase superfamily enzyme
LTAACVQIDAAVHNISLQEYPYDDDHGIKAELVKEPLKRTGGYLEVPTKPGIGVELNEEAFKH